MGVAEDVLHPRLAHHGLADVVGDVVDLGADEDHAPPGAEGVEDAGQLAFLRAHGCDEIQGHLVAPALEPDACLRLLQQPLRLPA